MFRRAPRAAGALRDHLHARSRARSTSRSASSPTHALGLTPVVFLAGRHLLRAGGDDLRRGRLAAPGPRRRDGLRPLRLQRAVELRRRLGDPARLRDPHRGHGVLGDELPGRVLGAAGRGARRAAARASAIIAYVAVRNIRGFSKTRVQPRSPRWSSPTSALQALAHRRSGSVAVLRPRHDHRPDRPRRRRRRGATLVFALGVATVVLHRASSRRPGCRARSRVGRRGLKRLVGAAAIVVIVVYVGIAVVAVTALPVVGNATSLGAQLPRGADARHRRGLRHRLAAPTR